MLGNDRAASQAENEITIFSPSDDAMNAFYLATFILHVLHVTKFCGLVILISVEGTCSSIKCNPRIFGLSFCFFNSSSNLSWPPNNFAVRLNATLDGAKMVEPVDKLSLSFKSFP